VEEYISYKKGLGYQIKIESEELRRFAVYTRTIGYNGSLTKDIAFQWATLKPEYSRWYMARRLETVRTFAKYICVFDPMAQIPPKGMFGKCHGRTTPYIFTEEEICILMKVASKLYSPDGLRCRTIPTAIALLWSTGMRPSELCQLMNEDVDLNNGRITIRETKFSKSRILPLHETTVSKLRLYAEDRDKLRKDFSDRHFLIMTGSHKLALRNLEYALQVIRDNLLTDTKEWNRRPPRLYDIRHSFACNTLLGWLKSGINVDNKILYLSTYLGHVKVADTYWYLTGTPELMQFAAGSFEKFFYGDRGVIHEE
jgi:integrase